MKNTILVLVIYIITLSVTLPCYSNEKQIKAIAVVSAKYDDIDKILNKYRIPYKTINYADLEKKEILDNYRTIFFPCGVDNPIETNVNILSRGTRIHSVSLKKDFTDISEEKIYKNIKSFIEKGGNAYFSDYSYKLLDGAFGSMKFFDDFPDMGMSSRINLELHGDLISFSKNHSFVIDMTHQGWVAVKSIKKSKVLADASFNTIKGEKTGAIISVMEYGDGQAIYTSWHHAAGDDTLQRFIIYNLSYKYILEKLTDKASFWQQDINNTVIDSIREWENHRSYSVFLSKGNNTIYFNADSGYYQIDIFDKDKKIIISRDIRDSEFHINIKSDDDQFATVKIYPSYPKTSGIYSIVSAKGIRILPYYKKLLVCILFIGIILLLYWINKNFGFRKFSGRLRLK